MLEPLVFHWRQETTYFTWELNGVEVLVAGMTILLDRGTSIADPNSFLLQKTLIRNLLLMHKGFVFWRSFASDFILWRAVRSDKIISFLVVCFKYYFSRKLLGCPTYEELE